MNEPLYIQGKASEIIGETITRLVGDGKVYGFPHPPISEIYEYLAKKDRFVPVLSTKEMANISLGIALSGKRTFIVTSGTGISDCMDAISYATAYEIPLLIIHIGKSLPGFGNPYPYQGDLDVLTGGDFPPVVYSPSVIDEIPLLLFRMVETSERYMCPAIFYLDSALLNMTGGANVDKTPDQPVWGLSSERRVFTSIYLDVNEMKQNISKLLDKYKKIQDDAQSEFYLLDDADYAIVAHGICAYISKKAVEELRLSDYKVGLIRHITLSPLSDYKKVSSHAKKLLVVEMSNMQLLNRIRQKIADKPIDSYNVYGGLLPDRADLIDYIKRSI